MTIIDRLKSAKLIPVIVLENADDAIPLCKALKAGGLDVAEFTFRTSAAAESIRRVRKDFPEFAVGAGTVTTHEELKAAKSAGAQFAVAPGCNPEILRAAREIDLPFFPGVATPSDVERALEAGCKLLKFFPASQVGGPDMIKTLFSVYGHRGISFVPTGGVSPANLASYLQSKGVVAVGGSWMVPPPAMKSKDWQQITDATATAVKLAAELLATK
jgi:2-dehydro-3-deoxyphosphogluconate aldolase / (4S)-4-hydroxy-2-oxoglutarate aldolase